MQERCFRARPSQKLHERSLECSSEVGDDARSSFRLSGLRLPGSAAKHCKSRDISHEHTTDRLRPEISNCLRTLPFRKKHTNLFASHAMGY